jgi:hypothetical protein
MIAAVVVLYNNIKASLKTTDAAAALTLRIPQ